MKNTIFYLALIILLLSENNFAQHPPLLKWEKNVDQNSEKSFFSDKRRTHRKLNKYKSNISQEQIKNVSILNEAYKNGTHTIQSNHSDSVFVEWISHYASNQAPAGDFMTAMAVDDSGNIYLTGMSLSEGGIGSDFATVKYNSLGELQWTARYTPNRWGGVYSIIVDNSGNVYVTGYCYGIDTTNDCVTIKYNSSGQELWVSHYNGQGNNYKWHDYANAIAIDKFGNVYITGSTGYYPAGSYEPITDFLTIKYNSNGEQQWTARYHGPRIRYGDEAFVIAVDDSGNVYILGESGGDYATIKYNSQGEEQWVARYNGPRNIDDYPYDIAIDDSGNVYVTGSCDGEKRSNYATIKYNSAGIEQWVAIYDGPYNNSDDAYAIALDDSGYVYVTGYSALYDYRTVDYVTIKYNSAGEEQWIARYNSEENGCDFVEDISVDSLGNVYVTGTSEFGFYSYYIDGNIATVKYNSSGELQWVAHYDGPRKQRDAATAIAIDKFNNIIIGGNTWGSTAGDYLIIKYNTAGEQQWTVQYNGPEYSQDIARAMALDAAGNLYVTGESFAAGKYEDYATIKYNSSGVQQWVAQYNGPIDSTDEPMAVAVDLSGNVYVTGKSKGLGTDYDFATVKYNSGGGLEWAARYNGTENDYDIANSIAVDDSGNVYVTGGCENSNTQFDYLTIKYNSLGEQQWIANYNGPYNSWDEAIKLVLDKQQNVYVTGTSRNDYATIKYNSAGETLWVARYNSPDWGHDGANDIAVDDSGNVYVTGGSCRFPIGCDIVTIKYNSAGESLWVARYNGPNNSHEAALVITLDDSGNVYVAGYSRSTSSEYDYIIIKYNPSGIEQWVSIYNGPGNNVDWLSAIALDKENNIYITGRSGSSSSTHFRNYDYATIKYNSQGEKQWIARYNGPGNDDDGAVDMEVDTEGNVYVTGWSKYFYNRVFTTIKYGQIKTSIKEHKIVPSSFKLYQNYPNPFNPSTTIKFDIPKASFVTLKIYNLLGQKVTELVNEEKQPGTYSVNWDASGFASGVYFYKLKAKDITNHSNQFWEVKKLILIK